MDHMVRPQRCLALVRGVLMALTLASASVAHGERYSSETSEAVELINAFAGSEEPGVAVAVHQNGETIFTDVRGLARLDEKSAITDRSVFCVGSVSKQFTAFAAQLLISEGKLSLDDDARRMVPEIAHYDEPILVRDLIYHSSGLKDIWFSFPLMGLYETDAYEHEHIQKMIARYETLDFSPGSRWIYSNSGYSALADVIAAASGEPFPDFVKRRVFEPLGMYQSSVRADTSELRTDAAAPYRKKEDGRWHRVPFGYASHGASGVWTSISDLGLWLNNLAEPIEEHKAAMSRMFDLGMYRNGETYNYASGLVPAFIAGQDGFRHSGHDQEFTAALVYLPKEKGGVIAIANRNTGVVGLANTVAEAFFDTGEVNPGLAKPAIADDLSAAGYYISEGGVGLTVRADDDGQGLVLISPNDTDSIVFREDGSFTRDDGTLPSGAFQRDDDGAVASLSTPFEGRGSSTPVVYYKQPADYGPMSLEEIKSGGFEGRYFSRELEAFIDIGLSEVGLTIENFRELSPLMMTAFGPDSFQVAWPAPAYTEEYTLHFKRDADGTVTGVNISNFVVSDIAFVRFDVP